MLNDYAIAGVMMIITMIMLTIIMIMMMMVNIFVYVKPFNWLKIQVTRVSRIVRFTTIENGKINENVFMIVA